MRSMERSQSDMSYCSPQKMASRILLFTSIKMLWILTISENKNCDLCFTIHITHWFDVLSPFQQIQFFSFCISGKPRVVDEGALYDRVWPHLCESHPCHQVCAFAPGVIFPLPNSPSPSFWALILILFSFSLFSVFSYCLGLAAISLFSFIILETLLLPLLTHWISCCSENHIIKHKIKGNESRVRV